PALWLIGICDGSGAILSRKAVEALGDKIATTLVGSGPYLVKEWRPMDRIVLEANPDYKGADKPYFQRIIAKPIPEPKTAVISFLAKEVAFAEIEPTAIPEIEKDADSAVIRMSAIDYTWLG